MQTEFAWLRDEVVLGAVDQNKQPRLARLLMIRRVMLRAAANRGHADPVGISEVDLGGRKGLAFPSLRQRHAVATPNLAKGAASRE